MKKKLMLLICVCIVPMQTLPISWNEIISKVTSYFTSHTSHHKNRQQESAPDHEDAKPASSNQYMAAGMLALGIIPSLWVARNYYMPYVYGMMQVLKSKRTLAPKDATSPDGDQAKGSISPQDDASTSQSKTNLTGSDDSSGSDEEIELFLEHLGMKDDASKSEQAIPVAASDVRSSNPLRMTLRRSKQKYVPEKPDWLVSSGALPAHSFDTSLPDGETNDIIARVVQAAAITEYDMNPSGELTSQPTSKKAEKPAQHSPRTRTKNEMTAFVAQQSHRDLKSLIDTDRGIAKSLRFVQPRNNKKKARQAAHKKNLFDLVMAYYNRDSGAVEALNSFAKNVSNKTVVNKVQDAILCVDLLHELENGELFKFLKPLFDQKDKFTEFNFIELQRNLEARSIALPMDAVRELMTRRIFLYTRLFKILQPCA